MKKKLLAAGTGLMVFTMMLSPGITAWASENEANVAVEYETSLEDLGYLESATTVVSPEWVIPRKYKVTANNVNIRTAANTSSDVVGKLYKGDIVWVKSINNGWAKFKYDGQWRYVSATYITEA